MRIVTFLIIFSPFNSKSQELTGYIYSKDKQPIESAIITIDKTKENVKSNKLGYFIFPNSIQKKGEIIIRALGFETKIQKFDINKQVNIEIALEKKIFQIDEIVITGTKTFKRQTNNPVIVNVITNKTLNSVEACNLAEGLQYQAGVRVETDCQTCNYTQLRMNGLGGGYSQILINGRPTFSPLTGLYGLEQIPRNMIERVEVVRGGGSSLYGSSAIGGVVNIITKIPTKNSASFYSNYHTINNNQNDITIGGNSTVISKNRKFRTSMFINQRDRDWYDHNGDNFSEIPLLQNKSFGTSIYYMPSEDSKLEINIGSIYEYRYGGEMIKEEPHFAMQAEDRTHNLIVGNIDFMKSINDRVSILTYIAKQQTNRLHYTGIRPEIGTVNDSDHLENPPYGNSFNTTNQFGFQINFKDYLLNNSIITLGSEFLDEDITDEIESYNYLIDQKTQNFGSFMQIDLNASDYLNILSGLRLDKHNMLEDALLSPRIALMYKNDNNLQIRATWSTGFRAPQAFDADLHMAFAGGGISRITLANNLEQEKSRSFSSSINYDKIADHYITGITLEGFYTKLDNVFYLQPIGNDDFGDLFEKRNGSGATVKGLNIELRLNYDKKIQIEAGYTIQSSLYDEAVQASQELETRNTFMRTPKMYGYGVLSITPNDKFYAIFNIVYTGQMDIIHFAGSNNQLVDEYVTTENFLNIGVKTAYILDVDMENNVEFSIGIKNIINHYQNDFDLFKNRDSNYIYGPSNPRTFFVGINYNLK